MTYSVLVRTDSKQRYVATALAFPNCSVKANTRQEALDGMVKTIQKLVAESEMIELEVSLPASVTSANYADTFGLFQSDPTFAEFQREMDMYRHDRNQAT